MVPTMNRVEEVPREKRDHTKSRGQMVGDRKDKDTTHILIQTKIKYMLVFSNIHTKYYVLSRSGEVVVEHQQKLTSKHLLDEGKQPY